ERVERVPRIKLRRAIPIKASLRSRSGWRGNRNRLRRGKSAVVAHRSCCRVVFRRDKLYFAIIQVQIIERFLNKVRVFVAYVPKLGRGYTNVHNAIAGVTITSGLEPGVVRMAIDFLFERIEDAHPRIRRQCRSRNGHINLLRSRWLGTAPWLTDCCY